MHRLFFALAVPDSARAEVRAAADRALAAAPRARAVAPARYHLTLHFLGSFATPQVDLVRRASVAAACVVAPPFELVIDRVGGFPRAGVWWLGCEATPPGLDALHAALGNALADAGIAVHRHESFTPHLTIARGATSAPRASQIPPIGWRVQSFALLGSASGDPDAAHGYAELGRWALDAPEPLSRAG